MMDQQVTEPRPQAARIVFDGVQTIRTIEAAHTALTAALAHHASVIVDCTGATEVDLSLIQLLLAARISAERVGTSVALAEPASGVLRAALLQGGFLPDKAMAPGPDSAFWLRGAATP